MEPRNWIGLGIIIIGVIIQPIGFMYFFWAQILSFVLIFVGFLIFGTQKYLDYKAEKEFSSGHQSGQAIPGDINDHSGWGNGGQSSSWTSSNSGGGDSCGGD